MTEIKKREKEILGEVTGRLERMEIKGVSIDSRTIRDGELFVAIKGDRFDGHDFIAEAIRKGAWGAIVDRAAFERNYTSLSGFKNIIPVEDTLSALQEMSAIHRNKFSMPVVGITGSNGKTTTKEMLACILKQKGPVLKNEGNLNNHIGVPLTLLRLNESHKSAVIEMGMSASGEIDSLSRMVKPDVGVITNIGPAHLEFFGSLDMVAEAKAEILLNLKSDDTAVLNADDRYFKMLKARFTGHIITFGLDARADITAGEIRQDKDYTDFTLRTNGSRALVRLRAVGRHNIYNALAAAAAAIAVGVAIDAVKYGLDDFSPISMRSELKDIKGRTVLADYYNANPMSMKAALETLISLKRNSKKTIAVLGDMLELGKAAADAHLDIGRAAGGAGVDILIAYGELSTKYIFEGAARAGMPKERIFKAASHSEAAKIIRELSRSGDAILIKGSRGMKMEKILEEF